MGVTHVFHPVHPRFFEAARRQPEILDHWLGYHGDDSGIDAEAFAASAPVLALAGPEGLGEVRSIDDGYSLEKGLPSILFALNRTFADEPEAWAALDGKSSPEFPVVELGEHAYGLPVVTVRRVAGLLAVIGTFRVQQAFDPQLFTALEVYPAPWSAEDHDFFESSRRAVERALEEAAKAGQALIIQVSV